MTAVKRVLAMLDLREVDCARLLESDAVPVLGWKQGNCYATNTGIAIHNLNTQETEKALREQGFCPRCRVRFPTHRPDCPAFK